MSAAPPARSPTMSSRRPRGAGASARGKGSVGSPAMWRSRAWRHGSPGGTLRFRPRLIAAPRGPGLGRAPPPRGIREQRRRQAPSTLQTRPSRTSGPRGSSIREWRLPRMAAPIRASTSAVTASGFTPAPPRVPFLGQVTRAQLAAAESRRSPVRGVPRQSSETPRGGPRSGGEPGRTASDPLGWGWGAGGHRG